MDIKKEQSACKSEPGKPITPQNFRLLEKVNGHWVGRVPTDVPLEFLSLNFRKKNPLRAIRAKCLDCCGGFKAETRKCVATDCALWPFRMGTNPFRKKPVLSEEEKNRRSERLKGRASHATRGSGQAVS